MNPVTLLPISAKGDCLPDTVQAIELVAEVIVATRAQYARAGFAPPWNGYLAIENNTCVGTCAFKSTPVEGAVEIAYFSFPGNEGRGLATRMARELKAIAEQQAEVERLRAQTLPCRNASTTVLEKLGFVLLGESEDEEIGLAWEWELPLAR